MISTAPTAMRRRRADSLLRAVLRRLLEPLSLILLVAGIISMLTGDEIGGSIIVLILTLSIGLDTVQEGHAVRTAEILRRSVALKAEVKRDGVFRQIEVESGRSRRPAAHPRRRHHPGRRADPRMHRVHDRRSGADRRALSGRRNAPAPARGGSRRHLERAVSRIGGADRRGDRARGQDRARHGVRRRGVGAGAGAGALAVRARPARIRPRDRAADARAGGCRAGDPRRVRPAGAGFAAVRRGAGGRPDARTAADDHDRDAVARRDADGRPQGDRQAAGRRSTISAPCRCCAPTRPAR